MASGRRGYTRQQVLAAIKESGGIVSVVARKLQCDWNTARKYIDRWAETRAAFQAERESVLDLAEAAVVRAIKEGDVGTAKWVLSRLGRHRGWGDNVDVTTGGEKLPIIIIREPNESEDGSS